MYYTVLPCIAMRIIKYNVYYTGVEDHIIYIYNNILFYTIGRWWAGAVPYCRKQFLQYRKNKLYVRSKFYGGLCAIQMEEPLVLTSLLFPTHIIRSKRLQSTSINRIVKTSKNKFSSCTTNISE